MSKDKRIEFHNILKSIIGSDNVYYQPPSKLIYPCIIYDKNDHLVQYGNDKKYINRTQYTITLIGKVTDNDKIIDKIMDLDYCTFDRRYISDNLYHDVFTIYY